MTKSMSEWKLECSVALNAFNIKIHKKIKDSSLSPEDEIIALKELKLLCSNIDEIAKRQSDYGHGPGFDPLIDRNLLGDILSTLNAIADDSENSENFLDLAKLSQKIPKDVPHWGNILLYISMALMAASLILAFTFPPAIIVTVPLAFVFLLVGSCFEHGERHADKERSGSEIKKIETSLKQQLINPLIAGLITNGQLKALQQKQVQVDIKAGLTNITSSASSVTGSEDKNFNGFRSA